MQLIKLVYIAHGWMLGLYGRQLITDDVEAWKFGPVIRRLYNSILGYGIHPVEQLAFTGEPVDFDEVEEDVVRQVYQKYGRYSGTELSRLTHNAGTPWDSTWKTYGKNVVIPQDLIEDHFHRLAHGAETEART